MNSVLSILLMSKVSLNTYSKDAMNLNPLYEVKLIIDKENDHHYYQIGEDPTFHQGVTGILDVISKHALLPWTAKVTAEYIRLVISRFRGTNRMTDKFLDLLVNRAKKQPRFVKELAAHKGSEAHSHFDRCIKENVDMPNVLYEASFKYFLKKNKLKIIQGDSKVASLLYKYGGSMDAIAEEEDGRLVVLDWKTGKYIYRTHGYQVGSYAQAMMETYGLDYLPGGYVVKFDKENEKYEIRKVNTAIGWRGFKNALDLFNTEQLDLFEWQKTVKDKVKEKKK